MIVLVILCEAVFRFFPIIVRTDTELDYNCMLLSTASELKQTNKQRQ